MSQNNQDHTINAGDDIVLYIDALFRESDGALIVSSDISGVSFAMSPYEDSSAVILEKQLANSGEITIGADGAIYVNIFANDTINLEGEFSYQIKVKTSLGTQTASRGRLTIKRQIGSNPVSI